MDEEIKIETPKLEERMKNAKYPIFKPNTEGQPFIKRLDWKNLLRIELTTLLFLIAILALLLSMKPLMNECKAVIENPCETAAILKCTPENISYYAAKNGVSYAPEVSGFVGISGKNQEELR